MIFSTKQLDIIRDALVDAYKYNKREDYQKLYLHINRKLALSHHKEEEESSE